MKAFNWLTRLRKDRRGTALAIGAAAMPLLIGAAAVGVDTIQLSLWKRQLQRAADSSALAGAYALSQEKVVAAAVNRDLQLNNAITPSTVVAQNAPTVGAFAGDNRAVRVALTAERALPFMAFFGVEPPTIRVEATARIEGSGPFCMLSLYEGTSAGIDVNGNSNVTLGCGMAANATGPSSITSGGTSSITADPIQAQGGIADGQNFVGNPDVIPYSSKQKDPFAHVPNPTVPSPCNGGVISSGSYGPGCYSGIDISPSSSVTLSPGTYVINGGDVDIKGNITGAKVTLAMTGTNGQAGDVKINSQAELNLTAPNSGDYKGIIFFRDRRASNIEITINGGAESLLEGALYFPTSDIKFAGNSGMNVRCLQMVGQILKFRGSASIDNVCPPGSGASAFNGSIVRLVA